MIIAVAFNQLFLLLKIENRRLNSAARNFENITKYASDLQTFLGMREIQSKFTDNKSRLKSMIANKSLEKVDIQFTINEKVSDILTSIKAFGLITIKKSSFACTNISSKKKRQAQISAPSNMHSINTIVVELNKKFATKYTYGSKEKLEAINGQSKTEYTIQLSTPFCRNGAFDVELIDDNTVAVTTGDPFVFGQREGNSVVDLTSRKAMQWLQFIDMLC
ncbi:unnamed protein product [Mytilus coruscus]|uniref:Uncharacterized protein n=1 Tax=Mytilus coruscus TaxID=42192 RepID=A0A6J8BJ13_MYTCO|nr:unnamed protein product [Mytilus coruscus]